MISSKLHRVFCAAALILGLSLPAHAESLAKRALYGDTLISESAMMEIKQLPYSSKRKLAQEIAPELKNDDAKVRERTGLAMQMIGPAAGNVVSALVETVHDPDVNVRCAVLEAFTAIGTRAQEAVPEMMEAINDENPRIRQASADALGSMQPTRYIVEALTQALDDREAGVRQAAATSLGGMREAAVKAIPALKEHLHDHSEEVRQSASDALFQIGAP